LLAKALGVVHLDLALQYMPLLFLSNSTVVEGREEDLRRGEGLGYYRYGPARSCRSDAFLDLSATFSSLEKTFVLCLADSSSFLVRLKLIQTHHASQGPFVSQRHASPFVGFLPHPVIFFDGFLAGRAKSP